MDPKHQAGTRRTRRPSGQSVPQTGRHAAVATKVSVREAPRSRSTAKATAAGRTYATVLAAAYADVWLAAADAVERGGSVADAERAFRDAWAAARRKAFKRHVEPIFSRHLPAGKEPADAAARARIVALWRAFADGLLKGDG